jgi:YebC/PmpR family DNA-binding regulatory protein
MSGHSHWSQIKHKKGAVDEKRAKVFSKLLVAVSVAARDNPNPDFNPRLRTAVETARAANVPNENIERALKRSLEMKPLEEIIVEAYGPEKAGMLIQGITDNRNRTIAEIRKILGEHEAKMADPGSVLWAFEKHENAWQAKFTQPVSPEGVKRLKQLIAALEDQNEVQRVTTNMKD